MGLFRIIAIPFGYVLKLAYMMVKNYGVALFLFTVVINLIMLPSRIKQQKESGKMANLRPKLEQIQKKYANNRDKLNEAQMELYSENGVSPMGSCLPMIVTYIVLFAVIEVVYAPMSYISSIPSAKIKDAQQSVVDYYYVAQAVKNDIPEGMETAPTIADRQWNEDEIILNLNSYNENLSEASHIAKIENIPKERFDIIAENFATIKDLDVYFNDPKKVSPRLIDISGTRAQLLVLSVAEDYPELFDQEVADFCKDFDYTIFGLYLGAYPSWNSVYLIIPILSLVFQLLIMFLSQYFMKKNGSDVSSGKGMMTALYIMPLISFAIAFGFPAGIGIYWIFSSIVQLMITIGINLYFTPARLEKILAKDAKKTKRPSIYQMALEQQRAMNAQNGNSLDDDEEDEAKLTKIQRKELERQKINDARKKLVDDDEDVDPRVLEARKRIAEKYGDES